jgi:hypothetical protein
VTFDAQEECTEKRIPNLRETVPLTDAFFVSQLLCSSMLMMCEKRTQLQKIRVPLKPAC